MFARLALRDASIVAAAVALWWLLATSSSGSGPAADLSGWVAGLAFFGHHVTPMAKSTFYFVLAVLIIVDIVQSRYQKKLLAQQAHLEGRA